MPDFLNGEKANSCHGFQMPGPRLKTNRLENAAVVGQAENRQRRQVDVKPMKLPDMTE
jgi:hypothetical protein